MINQRDIVNYLIDVKGYTEEEAIEYINNKNLTEKELKECEKYNR